MKLGTRHFGEMEIDENNILSFDEGLPGFRESKRFIILPVNENESPFSWLQSVDDGNLAFAVVNPFLVKSDYDFEICDDIVESLGIESPEDIAVLAIVVVPEDITRMTMNLRAPLIINARSNKGLQTVLDTDRYGVRHYIMEELQGREVSENAGTDTQERAVACNK